MSNNIYPCLWFDGKAREAADFYCSVFKDAVITADNQMVVIFKSSGQKFMCLNGGPEFKFNPSISFYVVCITENEIDMAWKLLSDGGLALMALDKYPWSQKYGWVQDKYGTSWQLSLGKLEEVGQKFSPLLMFTGTNSGRAGEAISFYTSVFEDSDIAGILKYEKGENDNEDYIKHSQFRLRKGVFMAMDSSFPHGFTFNEAISFVVECETQDRIDYFWDKLSDGGEEGQCGWLKDKFGVSWQVIPTILDKLMSDPSRSDRVIKAFLQMKKFEIDKLVNA